MARRNVQRKFLFAVVGLFLVLAGSIHAAPTREQTADAQRMLLQLGYDAGAVDGLWGATTRSALEAFAMSRGEAFDGVLDDTELEDLREAIAASNISMRPVSGSEIENSPQSFVYPPLEPLVLRGGYAWTPFVFSADFTGDGLTDLLYAGTMRPENAVNESESTGDACGGQRCVGELAQPVIFVGQKDGAYALKSLFADDRPEPGQSSTRQIVVNDFNGDGTFDVYLADHGLGTYQGFRDSYFLSQGDGTWRESSSTHLSPADFSSFDHGATSGDIDADGDADIVITNLKGRLDCWMNQGEGHMVLKTGCGHGLASSLELGDIDGDGFLDLLLSWANFGSDRDKISIRRGDGLGHFSRWKDLPGVEGPYIGVPEVAMFDIDADGDLDFVASRVGRLYVGSAIQVIENLGNESFSSTVYPMVEAPSDYRATSEGNEWNAFAWKILFHDVDGDDDKDIVPFGGTNALNPNEPNIIFGSYLRNDGGMEFTHILPDGGEGELTVLSQDALVVPLEELRKPTEASTRFSNFFESQGGKDIQSVGAYEQFSRPVPLVDAGAAVLGYRKIEGYDWEKETRIALLLAFGEHKFEAVMSIQENPEHNFRGFRFMLKPGWGGTVLPGRDQGMVRVGAWELDQAPRLKEIGFGELLWDLQQMGPMIVAAIDDLDGKQREVLAKRHPGLLVSP